MGRAEKRMAKKRSKKGPQYAGGRPLSAPTVASSDTVPRSVVEERLREVPCFGIRGLGLDAPSTAAGWLADEKGTSLFYLDAREAERACASLASLATGAARPRVEGIPLSTVYWDQGAMLKPSEAGLQAMENIPASRMLVRSIKTPLYCIDGMQTTDKRTQLSSLPFFFSRAELLEFASPVYGASEAAGMVLATDLEVVVINMLRGPAGPLRDAKFFAEAAALTAMDKQAQQAERALFPAGTGEAEKIGGLFPGGMKMPWQ